MSENIADYPPPSTEDEIDCAHSRKFREEEDDSLNLSEKYPELKDGNF